MGVSLQVQSEVFHSRSGNVAGEKADKQLFLPLTSECMAVVRGIE